MKAILNTINLPAANRCARRRFSRLFWHLSVFFLGISLPCNLEAAETKGDLPNFHVVHNYLLRGGEPSQAGLKKLNDMGITTIVDLRAPSEEKFDEGKECKELGLQYINLPMTSAAPTEAQVTTLLQTIDDAKKREPKSASEPKSDQVTEAKYPGAVFVHCAHGSDRTGCMIGIERVTHDHYTYPQAYEEMRKYYFTPKFTNLSEAVRKRAK